MEWQGNCGRKWRDIEENGEILLPPACYLSPLPKIAEPTDLRTEQLVLHTIYIHIYFK